MRSASAARQIGGPGAGQHQACQHQQRRQCHTDRDADDREAQIEFVLLRHQGAPRAIMPPITRAAPRMTMTTPT
jgi:hypothetical protein